MSQRRHLPQQRYRFRLPPWPPSKLRSNCHNPVCRTAADVPSLGVPAKPKLPVLPKPSAEDSEPEPSEPALPQIPKPPTASEAKLVLPPPPKPKATVDDVDDETRMPRMKRQSSRKHCLMNLTPIEMGKLVLRKTPSAEQLKKFTTRRREKPKVDRLDNKRKSRLRPKAPSNPPCVNWKKRASARK